MEEFDNPPTLPKKPVQVAKAQFPQLALASRSVLSVAFRHVKPNWRHYIQYVEMAAHNGDTQMARYLGCYESLSKADKASCWPEQLCGLADVSPGELIGAVCRAIWESKAAESSMISSMAHPELLMQTAKLAADPEAYRDRELFFRLTGSLPDKKGASINIFNNNPAGQDDLPVTAAQGARGRLRSFDEEVVEMSRELDSEPPFLVKDVSP